MAVKRLTSEKRKSQIADVAAGLFASRGFDGVTTREIAKASGVSEAIVFRHFPTKDALYTEIIRGKMDILPEKLDEAAIERGDDAGVFRSAALAFLRQIKEDDTFLRLMLYSALGDHKLASVFLESRESVVFDLLLRYIERRIGEGVFRNLKPAIVVNSFVGMYFHFVLSWKIFRVPKQFKITRNEALEQFVDIFLNGIRV